MALTTLLITQRDIDWLISMKTAVRVIEDAFRAQGRGQTLMPPKVYLNLPGGIGDFRAMPAFLGTPRAAGLKWVNVHPKNRAKGLPTVMGTIIINDPATGFPLAIMDGLSVTRLRTGAAAGVAAKYLARSDASRVGLVGCGAQAIWQLSALAEVRRLRHVAVWGYRAGEARAFCRRHQGQLAATLVPVSTVQACVRDAQIIVTVTSARGPLVKRPWIASGTHLNAIGADAPGKQELDPAILRDALVIVDERQQSMHGGELNVPIAKGQYRASQIHAELGAVVLGKVRGRTRATQITVFDSTGLAIHDVALGAEIVRQATRRGVGRAIRLFDWP